MLKRRFSAFIRRAADPPVRLSTRCFDNVLVGGTVTKVCCESSARHAMMLDFRTIMVADANAAMSNAEHNASFANFGHVFGDVMTVDHVIARLSAAAPGVAA